MLHLVVLCVKNSIPEISLSLSDVKVCVTFIILNYHVSFFKYLLFFSILTKNSVVCIYEVSVYRDHGVYCFYLFMQKTRAWRFINLSLEFLVGSLSTNIYKYMMLYIPTNISNILYTS